MLIYNISKWEIIRNHILVYDISCKVLTEVNSLRISFGKVNGFIKVYDGAR